MTKTPIVFPWAEEISGTYWTPLTEMSLAEVHPLLMAAVLMVPDRENWAIYSVNVYDMASGAPIGSFDVAFNRKSAKACGYFSAVGSQQPMPSPLSFDCAGDESDVIEAFYALMKDAGHVD